MDWLSRRKWKRWKFLTCHHYHKFGLFMVSRLVKRVSIESPWNVLHSRSSLDIYFISGSRQCMYITQDEGNFIFLIIKFLCSFQGLNGSKLAQTHSFLSKINLCKNILRRLFKSFFFILIQFLISHIKKNSFFLFLSGVKKLSSSKKFHNAMELRENIDFAD